MTEQIAMSFYAQKPRVALVCGGRRFDNKSLLFETLDDVPISCVVHGGAEGADSLAGEWARERRIPEVIVPAQWRQYGKSAGTIRNRWMIRFTRTEFVIAFPGGQGTENMIEQARKAGIPIRKV